MINDRLTVTVSESLAVARPPEDVFDYTQDYGRRTDWDRSVTEAHILSESPRRIRIHFRGLGRFTVAYQLFRRPEQTSAAFIEVESPWISGGGGSWRYERTGDGTRWTQTNTLELKRPGLLRIMAPLIERNLRATMRRSMAEAKRMLEA